MGYAAVYLQNEEYDQTGFDTKQEAYKYIEALACDLCVDDIKRGFVAYMNDGVETRDPVDNVLHTHCGAAWFVVTDEEYEKAETIEDILIAAGLIPGDAETAKALTDEQKARLESKRQELEARHPKQEPPKHS